MIGLGVEISSARKLVGTAERIAPKVWDATDAADGLTAATGSVTTDRGEGRLYWVATASPEAPSAAQVRAGRDRSGAAAAASGSQAVTAAGAQTLVPAPSGLKPGTPTGSISCRRMPAARLRRS